MFQFLFETYYNIQILTFLATNNKPQQPVLLDSNATIFVQFVLSKKQTHYDVSESKASNIINLITPTIENKKQPLSWLSEY